MRKKLTQAEFIARAQMVHSARYDYSLAVYVDVNTKLTIICPDHGVFEQRAGSHLRHCGCSKCGAKRTGGLLRSNATAFIEKSIAIHGQRYDYSHVKYNGATRKVTIICDEHGPFEQSPNGHLSGKGCRKCGLERSVAALWLDTATFIEKARAVHGLKYDYSLCNYIGGKLPVTIICPKHGPFEQLASTHLTGCGCQICGGAAKIDNEGFLARARAVHGLKYDYSLTQYAGWNTLVTIICPVHGLFKQQAAVHSKGHGCAVCAHALLRLSWVNRSNGKEAILYFLRIYNQDEGFYKIGITIKTVERRYSHKTALNGYSYEILAQHQSTNAAAVWDWEQSILETFAHLRYRPKISFGGETECFSSAEEILAIFPL